MIMVLLPRIFVKNVTKRMTRKTAPLLGIPYNVQLKMKELRAQNALKYFSFLMTKNSTKPPPEGFLKEYKQHAPLPCLLEPIRKTDNLTVYRNKNTTSIDFDIDGKVTVGHVFNYTNVAEKIKRRVCVSINDLPTVDPIHSKLFKTFEDFLLKSKYKHHSYTNNYPGQWLGLISRSNRKGEAMFCCGFNTMNVTEEDVAIARKELLDIFLPSCLEQGIPLKSFHWQLYPNYKGVTEVLHGDPYIMEECLGLQFQISPLSFFQVNTDAAEILYTATREMLKISNKTLLLDICCGTGTIGILMSDIVSHVVGVDIVPSAIVDAKNNAKLNSISNIEFVCEDAENFLADLVKNDTYSEYDQVIAVVNPHRDGLSSRMMRKVRECERVRQVVYLSCRPENKPTYNFFKLCKTGNNYFMGEPFVMTRVIPLDPFPQTKFVELVINFER